MAQTQKNQTEGEFFALVATGRKGVEDMLAKMGPEMRVTSAPNVRQDFDTWSQRALVEVTTSDTLREVIRTKDGIYSIYQGLSKAATLGLQIGGQFPHAYFVPKGGKAALIPSQDGYIFATTYGPGAIFATPPMLMEVYDKDEFQVRGTEVTHNFEPFKDRGKLVGFYTILELKDGRHVVRTVTMDEVDRIEKGYGLITSPAYQKSKIDMDRKTAMKKMLKPFVKICEGLSMLMQMEDGDAAPVIPEREPDLRDVTERAADRLDAATAAIVPEETPKPEPKVDPEIGELEIF